MQIIPVKKFLGEGGKKKVFLAHDTTLDRDVAFALIKTEKLDEAGNTRIIREVKAMGKLGDHPNIVTVYDFGDHEGQPYIVLPLLSGGDVEGLIKKAPDHKLPLDKALEIARAFCKGLEFAHAKAMSSALVRSFPPTELSPCRNFMFPSQAYRTSL